MKLSIQILAFVLSLMVALSYSVHAQVVAQSEGQNIEALIKYVEQMNDVTFVRNGSSYDAKTAATFLRLK